jgi:hypothetical protein
MVVLLYHYIRVIATPCRTQRCAAAPNLRGQIPSCTVVDANDLAASLPLLGRRYILKLNAID